MPIANSFMPIRSHKIKSRTLKLIWTSNQLQRKKKSKLKMKMTINTLRKHWVGNLPRLSLVT